MMSSVSSLLIDIDGVTAIQVTCCVSLVELVMSIAIVACAVAILQCGPKMFRSASGQAGRLVSRKMNAVAGLKQSAPERIFISKGGKKYHRLASCAGATASSYDASVKCCHQTQQPT